MISSKIVRIQTAVANLRLKISKEDILLDACGNVRKVIARDSQQLYTARFRQVNEPNDIYIYKFFISVFHC